MVKFEKTVFYFKEPGPENTDEVIKAVAKRLEEGDINTVVVASTSGRTGLKFAETLKGKAKVVAVSYERMEKEFKEKIVKAGGLAVDETNLPLHEKGVDDIRNAFFTLGQGFKVAIEVILIACNKNLIEPYKDVIGVAGSGEGSDTAIVARATTSKEIFCKDVRKKLEVREIIAMPLKKKWW
ncbi:MAG: pyruvate kinase alpha/beta domain-containing protein [Nitrososphaeria archaeon]